MQTRMTEIGGFQTILAGPGDAQEACVFLHGFGANAQDLMGLSQVMPFANSTDFYFLNAPIEIFPGGFSWFPLDPMTLQSAIESGNETRLLSLFEPGISEIGGQITEALAEVANNYERLFIGGFSQGSMVALEVAFRLDSKTTAAILFSSAPANLTDWTRRIADSRTHRFPVFQSHGQQDPVLPYQFGERLRELWTESQWPHEFMAFRGGHEIPPQVLQAVVKLKDKHSAQTQGSHD